jgi:hypothetical protein
MDVATLAASAVVIIQFIKTKILAAVWDKLGSVVQYGISVLVCAGVVIYHALALSIPFNFNLLWLFIEVVTIATGGYKLATQLWPGLNSVSK